MGYVEISMDEGEDMKVVLHNKLRFLLRRLRVNDLQRHLVATRPNCSCAKRRMDDASFILVLKALFLFCLSLSLTATFYELYKITTLPLAAVFVIVVLVRMKSRPSSQESRVEVKTISGDIHNLRLNDELNIKS